MVDAIIQILWSQWPSSKITLISFLNISKIFVYRYHLVNVFILGLGQSDHIKRLSKFHCNSKSWSDLADLVPEAKTIVSFVFLLKYVFFLFLHKSETVLNFNCCLVILFCKETLKLKKKNTVMHFTLYLAKIPIVTPSKELKERKINWKRYLAFCVKLMIAIRDTVRTLNKPLLKRFFIFHVFLQFQIELNK